jgi:hypothetical protein
LGLGFGLAFACVLGFGFGWAFREAGFFVAEGLWVTPALFLEVAFLPPALDVRLRLEEVEARDEAIRPQFAGEQTSPARMDA